MATATKARTRTAPETPPGPAHGKCRLTLTIDGKGYTVRPLAVDRQGFAAVKAFRLRKADGTVYDVERRLDGFGCTCADHTFRREGRTAAPFRHAAALAALGVL